MAKKVTVISTSIRPNSNSELLAKSFAEGAEAAGNEVTFITLKDKDIRFCRGCLSCHQTGKCIIQDDVAPIMDAVLQADVVAWATPIYYFEMSGQMKTLIDRMNPMYPKDYRFRDVYFLATAAGAPRGDPVRRAALFGSLLFVWRGTQDGLPVHTLIHGLAPVIHKSTAQGLITSFCNSIVNEPDFPLDITVKANAITGGVDDNAPVFAALSSIPSEKIRRKL